MMFQDRFVHYTLGIEEIDQQHWSLFEKMNKILTSYLIVGVSLPQLEDLRQEVVAHFRSEEQFMRNRNYDHIDYHIAEHEVLEAKLADMIRGHVDITSRSELVRALEIILIKHIDTHDRQLMNL